MRTPQSVASIYAAWLERESLNALQGADRLSIAVATSYQYANGESVPTARRAAEFAAKIGADPAVFARVAAADRARLRRKRMRSHGRGIVANGANSATATIERARQ